MTTADREMLALLGQLRELDQHKHDEVLEGMRELVEATRILARDPLGRALRRRRSAIAVEERSPLERFTSAARRLAELDEPRLQRLASLAESYVAIYDRPEMPEDEFHALVASARKAGAA